jgi:hypothetical protein
MCVMCLWEGNSNAVPRAIETFSSIVMLVIVKMR